MASLSVNSNAPNDDWQTHCSETTTRLAFLLKSGDWTDCSFQFESDGSQIEAHKLVLAMVSPVFARQFYGSLPETGPILITDIQPASFKALLEYIYMNEVNISSLEIAWDLYYAAKKYILPHLKQKCSQYLTSHITSQNVCHMYKMASMHEDSELMKLCLMLIGRETTKVLESDTFLEADVNTVNKILDMDPLAISNELVLFKAITMYSEAQKKNLVTITNSEDTYNNYIQYNTKYLENQQPLLDVIRERARELCTGADAANGERVEQHTRELADSWNVSCEGLAKLAATANHQLQRCSQFLDVQRSLGAAITAASDRLRQLDASPSTRRRASDTRHALQELKKDLEEWILMNGPDKEASSPENCQTVDVAPTHQPHPGYLFLEIRAMVKKLRFLTLTPKQFADCDILSRLLTKEEILALNMNISSRHTTVPMPDGFSRSRMQRNVVSKSQKVVTHRSIVLDVSSLDVYQSSTLYASNVPWYITVRPMFQLKNNIRMKVMTFSIHCDFGPDTEETYQASCAINIIGRKNYAFNKTHVFTREQHFCQFQFSWDAVMDPVKGLFLVENNAINYAVKIAVR